VRGVTLDGGRYKVGDIRHIAIFSDPHIRIRGDNRKLIADMKTAQDMGALILLNGDLSDFIYHLDKRYTPESEDGERTAAKVDEAVDFLIDLLSPFGENIRLINYGNHEQTVLDKYLTDPVARVCKALKVEAGGYRSLVRIVYEHESGGRVRNLTIYLHHGSGGVTTQSKGITAIREMILGADADCYVVGHGHRAAIDAGDVRWYMDRSGNVRTRVVKGMQVPGYQEPGSASGVNWEDKFYRPTPTGWGLITVELNTDELDFDLSVKVNAGR
jgi:predicted phosphodiesterase